MFKSARWRGEKNRIKEVFKLQFHATQVSQPGVDALTVSLVPGDVGKPTLKLERAIVQDGTCRWENPAYETVKFVREPKTGKINERVYHFIVSSGSSKAGLIGEATIDFAEYAESTKASTISLPLKNLNSNSKSNTILHVLVRRLQDIPNEREMEETEDVKTKSHGRSLKSQFSIGDTDDNIKSNSNDQDDPFNKTTHCTELNGNRRVSSGSDITLSSSETSSGLNTPRELTLRNSIQPDPTSFLSSLDHSSMPHKPKENASSTIYEEHQRSQWGWLEGSDPGASTDDSMHSSQDTNPREWSQQASEVEIEKLKTELVVLARQADVSELELQTLRKQIIKESKRGQDLSREVVSLKEERNALKEECEKLKAFQKLDNDTKAMNKLQAEGGDAWTILEEIRQELNHEKDQNANLRIQLQKTQESNAELLLAVQDLDEMLEQKDREMSNISNRSGAEELKGPSLKCETDDDDEEQKALEELVREHTEAKDTYILEQKIVDLYNEIEIYRRDKDELEMHMEQLALDYEILKQENHDISYRLEQSEVQEQLKMQYECSSFVNVNELERQVESLENELKKQSNEFSDSLATINKLESRIKNLEEELENQAQRYEADVEALTRAKVEQEQRAIRAEETLRKTRWTNANTADRLQEEVRRLSMQMASTFEANEKVAMKALTEAGDLRMQKRQLEGMLHKASEELQAIKDAYEVKLLEFSNQLDLRTNQIEEMLLENDNKSKQLESQTKHEEEVSKTLSQEILVLKAEVDRLTTENNFLAQQAQERENLSAQLEKMNTSFEETELLVQQIYAERAELLSRIALLKNEADKSLEELNSTRRLKEEKEAELELLQSELVMFKSQCNDLKDSLVEDELEKDKLQKQVFQLKADLKKKDDAFTALEKKLKDHNGRQAVYDGTKTTPRNNKAAPVPRNSKEIDNMREQIKVVEGQIKSKEAVLETSTNLFLEKEKDLQKRIEELESTMEELNQNSANLCGQASQKVSEELLSELTSLKERNNSMESELKEMQERYSEISLKFAEVEGERQQLVMTVRNLKNARKSK